MLQHMQWRLRLESKCPTANAFKYHFSPTDRNASEIGSILLWPPQHTNG